MKNHIAEVSYSDPNVAAMIDKLDRYQIGLYGIEMCNLDSPEALKRSGAYMLGAYRDDILMGIGAVKLFPAYAEIKRMYIDEAFRGSGAAVDILGALERYSKTFGIKQIFLETGYLQQQAIAFYKRCGYRQVEKFGSYQPNRVSVYFAKAI